ncbi:DUF3800 domain-containing protein [Mesorhizobium sp. M0491]|uniref:DUF3800 domain-containing protein n=1 Tax=Mesorhizobium sp. M0491 TaxID=2956950 RepID=UPI003336E348
MPLQAFSDDSASEIDDKRLFFAGYLNSAARWALFAEAWDEELRAKPSIAYLKMAEAQNLRDQFRGWSVPEKDQKLRSMVRVIHHFAPTSFEFSVSRKAYWDDVKPVAPRGIQAPHFVLTYHVMAGLSQYAVSVRNRIPIDFIFDDQEGVQDDVDLFFSYMKKQIPRKARKLIVNAPVFRSDRDVLPLQAADMLAWHLRREHEAKTRPEDAEMAQLLRSPSGHLVSEVPGDSLKTIGGFFATLPAISGLQSKPQWRTHKQNLRELILQGYLPPHGTRWKNFLFERRHDLSILLDKLSKMIAPKPPKSPD